MSEMTLEQVPPTVKDMFNRGFVAMERNNLDLNTGAGSFDYDLLERTAYVESLSRAGAVSQAERDYDILSITTNGSRWEIRLPRNSGHGVWSSQQLRERRTSGLNQ